MVKNLTSYGKRLGVMFKIACHCTLSRATLIQSKYTYLNINFSILLTSTAEFPSGLYEMALEHLWRFWKERILCLTISVLRLCSSQRHLKPLLT